MCAERRRVPRETGARDSGLPRGPSRCASPAQRLPPGSLDRVDALADNHGIDRDFARWLAAEQHRYEGAA
jgi:hypothetical protein